MTASDAWSLSGAGGEPILGDAHRPAGAPRGVLLLAHGFKGYKDYGMFPRLATALAGSGFVAHRFNFSHSGMTNRLETFERPELFERDTWNRQVDDLRVVIDAAANGVIDGAGLPCVLFGHSRGGVTALLTVGRHGEELAVAGVMTAAAPSGCSMMPPEQEAELLERGFLESPSSRTGQVLRVGKAYLQEQRDDPAGHDLLAVASRIRVPTLVVHGADDPTVPAACAAEITNAIGPAAETLIIEGGNHVFNTPNPLPPDAEPSPELATLIDAMTTFATRVCPDA